MKELLSRVGIGAATVDTVLPTTTLTAGEPVDATVHVEGGDVEQEIDAIYFAVCTEYHTEESTARGAISKTQLTDPFTIGPNETRDIDVTIPVPRETPITRGRTPVWIETGLDVAWAVDPDDTDHVEVEPAPRLAALLDAADDLGLGLRKAEVGRAKGSLFGGGPTFVQEFEFVPRTGPLAGTVDEVELVPTPREDRLDVYLEVDRRGGVFSELADVDERFERFEIEKADPDPDAIRDDLETRIERNS